MSKYIDHTQLRPGVGEAELKQACEEAREFGFYSVCVYWNQVAKIAPWLAGTGVLPIAVVGFPGGDVETQEKVRETLQAIADGAKEIDMVVNRKLLTSGDTEGVLKDIQAVVQAAGGAPVKVILETSELSDPQKRQVCELAVRAGAKFVKTSTGFSGGGAVASDVALMRQVVGPNIGVKASGGIRTYEKALEMISAGASRLGTSASVDIAKGGSASEGGY